MNSNHYLTAVGIVAMSSLLSASAAIELVTPANDSVVQLLPEVQRVVLVKDFEERLQLSVKHKEEGDYIRWHQGLPLKLSWRCTETEKGPWEVLIGKKPDLSDAKQYLFRRGKIDQATGREISGSEVPGEITVTIPLANLEIATRYYWKVTSDLTCGFFGHSRANRCENAAPMHVSSIGTFTTEDLAPRWIKIDGNVGNFRDLGGRIGLDGRRVKQGMLYRSQGLNDNSTDGCTRGRNRLTVEDVDLLVGQLGIKTDHDLRGPGEVAGMTGSPLGDKVKWVHRSSECYVGIFGDGGKKIMAENFRLYCDETNYPILFHCIGGADRTGALAYVLNGVLGVSQRELETDWEITFYPFIPYKNDDGSLKWNSEQHFRDGFSKYGDENSTWTDRIVLYLKDCGITDAEIAKFRDIMLEKK